jgi:hypothetical protein
MRLAMTICILACTVATAACGQQQSLAPDLAFNFECKKPPSEAAIEEFLRQHDFEVANPERVRRQFHRGFFPMQILAVDKRSWEITFQGLDIPAVPTRPEHVYYAVTVDSPPPTRHDAALENVLITFVSQNLGCQANSIARYENPANAAEFFSHLLSMQKNGMHEAEVCDKTVSTYNAAECANVPGVPQ